MYQVGQILPSIANSLSTLQHLRK